MVKSFDHGAGTDHDQTIYILNVQPVIPLKLTMDCAAVGSGEALQVGRAADQHTAAGLLQCGAARPRGELTAALPVPISLSEVGRLLFTINQHLFTINRHSAYIESEELEAYAFGRRRERGIKTLTKVAALLSMNGGAGLLALAVGCATTMRTEDLLPAAVFKIVPATTPELQARLKAIPAHKGTMVQRDRPEASHLAGLPLVSANGLRCTRALVSA
jgi:hypothetical protein